jgi:hypothetical protein
MTEGNRNGREPEKQGVRPSAEMNCRLATGPDQEPRRPVIPEMVLAIVVETKANMANARATTITANPLFRQCTEGQVSFQRLALYFQQDTRGKRKSLSGGEDNCL